MAERSIPADLLRGKPAAYEEPAGPSGCSAGFVLGGAVRAACRSRLPRSSSGRGAAVAGDAAHRLLDTRGDTTLEEKGRSAMPARLLAFTARSDANR